MTVKTSHPIILLLLLSLMCMAGCKRCYNCSSLAATFVCHKGIDTVTLFTAHGKTANDSLQFYSHLGYLCDTIDFYFNPEGYYHNPVCKKELVSWAKEMGDKCYEEK